MSKKFGILRSPSNSPEAFSVGFELPLRTEREKLLQAVGRYAARPMNAVNISEMAAVGSMGDRSQQLLGVACWLHHELPVRLAHLHQALEQLPNGLSSKHSIERIKHWRVTP